ncbi:MAG: BamA/TamA family outer membrane protein [Pseudomonadota bacterium]
MFVWLVLFVLFVWLCVPRLAAAGDGSLVWRTIETDHFAIHYYEPNEDIARRLAAVAERAHLVLAAALDHRPRGKTEVVITDDTDSANGYAMAAPRNAIHLYATAPGPLSSLGDHDDWLYVLFVHEYSHVLHLDTSGGLPYVWNRIFGKQWLPNQIQPRWFIEGLATYEESKRTAGGRTRNAIFDMLMRMAVLEGKELRIDELCSEPLRWPHGNAAYLYGAFFVKYIADRYGDDKIAKISRAYGRHPIPWNLGRAARLAVGKNIDELHAEWRADLAKRYALQKAAVLRRGLIEGRKATESGEGNSYPRYTADGRSIVWQQSDGYSRGRYRIMPRGSDAARAAGDLAAIDGAIRYSLLQDGSGMVLERYQAYRTNYSYADLYYYDFAERTLARLTRGARASSPAVSPDGTRVAFVVNSGSRTRLALMPMPRLERGGNALFEDEREREDEDEHEHEREREIVWEGPSRFDQAGSPAWSPDGRWLAFSAWTEGGYRDIYLLDVETQKLDRLFADRAIDAEPRWSPDGRWIYFVSDRTGIFNVYAGEPRLSGRLWQVTNVLGGVISFDVAPDGQAMVYSGYHAGGYDIYEHSLAEKEWLLAEVYVDDRPEPARVEMLDVMPEPRAYRPLETLAPDTWKGSLIIDESSGTMLGASTWGGDVVGLHSYGLGAAFASKAGDLAVAGSYAYRRYWPSLWLNASRGVGAIGGLFVDGSNTAYREESWGLSLGIGLPVLRVPGASSDLTFAYDLGWKRNLDSSPPLEPDDAVMRLPEIGVVTSLSVRWSLSTLRYYGYAIGPQEGFRLSLGTYFCHPALGSDYRSVQFGLRWESFWQLPWLHHVLALRLSSAIEQTDRARDGPFYLGGLGRQDIVDAILHSTRVGTWAGIRGYPQWSMAGRQYHLLNLEYRLPLLVVERGLGMLPIYVRRLHAAVVLDAGNASDGPFDARDLRLSVGASLRLDVVFGFFAGGAFDVGWVRGLTNGGRGEYWFLLTQGL